MSVVSEAMMIRSIQTFILLVCSMPATAMANTTLSQTSSDMPHWASTTLLALVTVWSMGVLMAMALHFCAPLLNLTPYRHQRIARAMRLTTSTLTLASVVMPYLWSASPTLAVVIACCFAVVGGVARHQQAQAEIEQLNISGSE